MTVETGVILFAGKPLSLACSSIAREVPRKLFP